MYQDEPDYKRLFTAIFLAGVLLIGWQALVEFPKRQKLAQYTIEQAKKAEAEKAAYIAQSPNKEMRENDNPALSRKERLAASSRIPIQSPALHGSIDLKGARFDDLTLVKYRETADPKSPEVVLLSPSGDSGAYFVQAGWLTADGMTKVPDGDTLWRADRSTLSPGQPLTLTWDNGQGQHFEIQIALDEHYMFQIRQRMENHAQKTVSVFPYAFINRVYHEPEQHYYLLHEGPLGVMEGALEELNYSDLREKGNKVFEHASGWLGITDKYWLTALIPQGEFKATFSHYKKGDDDRYQADYLSPAQPLAPGAAYEQQLMFFAGAKELDIINGYAEGSAENHIPPIPLFDRAVDFGTLYFLTKPMFLLLNFFFLHVGNFGIAIMLMTIVVKLLMYPLANKSFHAMAQMRELQPEIVKLRERYFDDQIKMNQEMMALYKREKVNPASGCLPVIIQMPVFFALYKVLFVSIEMRHAPFFGWIHDLSAADPSNIFTLFGILDWGAPPWLHLGVLPMVMCATMVIQMRQQPKPADPVQAKVFTWMPYFFLFIFAGFPAGLVLYWAWSNILSILQQQVITQRHRKTTGKSHKAA